MVAKEHPMKKSQSAKVDSENLRVARIRRRLRQRDVARQLNISPQRISDFETGVRFPTPEQLTRLAEILGPSIITVTGME
jgi:transcriptional regulator with XRE-family HTH domain